MDGYVCARLAGFFAMLCAVMEEEKFGRMVGRDSEKRWEEVDVRRKERGGKGFDVTYSDLICAE
jgi:hypothetical protein